MKKICRKCGFIVNERYQICPNCGQADFNIDDNTNIATISNNEEKQHHKELTNNGFVDIQIKKRFKKTVPFILFIFFFIAFVFLFILSSPLKKINNYYSGIKNANVNKVKNVMHPQYIKSYDYFYNSNSFDKSIREIFKNFKQNNITLYNYNINKNYKNYKNEQLLKYIERIESNFGIKKESIKKVRKYKITVKYKKRKEIISEKEEIFLVKIGHKWYVFINI